MTSIASVNDHDDGHDEQNTRTQRTPSWTEPFHRDLPSSSEGNPAQVEPFHAGFLEPSQCIGCAHPRRRLAQTLNDPHCCLTDVLRRHRYIQRGRRPCAKGNRRKLRPSVAPPFLYPITGFSSPSSSSSSSSYEGPIGTSRSTGFTLSHLVKPPRIGPLCEARVHPAPTAASENLCKVSTAPRAVGVVSPTTAPRRASNQTSTSFGTSDAISDLSPHRGPVSTTLSLAEYSGTRFSSARR